MALSGLKEQNWVEVGSKQIMNMLVQLLTKDGQDILQCKGELDFGIRQEF